MTEYNYDMYLLFSVDECDDKYYPSYHRLLRIYKSKDDAIQDAKDTYKRVSENVISNYKVEYYVKGYNFINDINNQVKPNIIFIINNDDEIKN